MKKTVATTLVLVLFFSLSLEAQVLKRLGKRVTNRVEQTISRKIEDKAAKKTGEVMDDILEGEEKKQKERQKNNQKPDSTSNDHKEYSEEDTEERVNAILGGILGAEKVEVRDSYNFSFTATMEFSKDDKKEEKNTVIQSYGDEAMLNQGDTQKGLVIMDWENEGAIMIDEEKKTAQVVSMAWMKKMMQQEGVVEDVEESASKIVKTGKTKMKNGYKCYEYVMEDEEAKVITWYAPDVKFSYTDYLSSFTKVFGANIDRLPLEQGYAMETIMYDKVNNQTSRMEVVDISEKKITVNLSDYEVQSMFGN